MMSFLCYISFILSACS